MVDAKYFMEKIQDVKVKDYLSFFPMAAALALRPFYKTKYGDAWLICEERFEARDNGYHFFKYMCENQPQQKCFYAIGKKSVDYEKVSKLGETIEFGSVQHWLAYFLCRYNISSQKGGKPNAAVCSFMELSGRFKPHNVFLQHGITINKVKYLFHECARFDYFITSTIPETEYIEKHFGYPEGTVHLTGMPRFDALHDIEVKPKRILIMPTWRQWFNLKSKQSADTDADFGNSEYLKKWLELLNSPKLKELIEKYQLEVIFYPHRHMQPNLDKFQNLKNPVTVASWKKFDIQELLKSSALMITDYSSVFFDMAYMKKPVIFYQFDEEKFRKHQYDEGYFEYHHNPFGKCFRDADGVLADLSRLLAAGLKQAADYEAEHKKIFKYYDKKNSERIYRLLSDPK